MRAWGQPLAVGAEDVDGADAVAVEPCLIGEQADAEFIVVAGGGFGEGSEVCRSRMSMPGRWSGVVQPAEAFEGIDAL